MSLSNQNLESAIGNDGLTEPSESEIKISFDYPQLGFNHILLDLEGTMSPIIISFSSTAQTSKLDQTRPNQPFWEFKRERERDIYINIHIYIYIHIYREREQDVIYVYIYIL